MFLPENQKKLTNVSIVTLKRHNRKYELAVYPNKLYEYRHNPQTPLSTVLHSDCIFKSVATGEVCAEADLELFQMPRVEVIHCILREGHEQKAAATSQHELESIEKQIVDLVQTKVLYKGRYVPKENLLDAIRKTWNIKNTDAKRQVSGIIKKLEELGFDRVRFKIRIGKCLEELEELKEIEHDVTDDGIIVRSDVLPDAIEALDRCGSKYVITKVDEVEEEIIC